MNWQQHTTAKCPVPETTNVLVRKRDGSYDNGKASEFRWEPFFLGNDPRDITDWCEVVEPRYSGFKAILPRYKQVSVTGSITPEVEKVMYDIYDIAKIIDEQPKATQ